MTLVQTALRTKRVKLLSALVGLLAGAVGLRAVWQAGQARGYAEGSYAAGLMWRSLVAKDLMEGRLVLVEEETGDFGPIEATGADHMWQRNPRLPN